MPTPKFKRGHPKKGGRKKGTSNKFTSIKQSFLDAFDKIGGTQGLVKWINESKRNKTLFYQLTTKLFPTSIVGGDEEDSEPIRIIYMPAKKEEKKK